MEKTMSSPSGLARTTSDQQVETIAATFKSPPAGGETAAADNSSNSNSGGGGGSGGTLSRKSSRSHVMTSASPGRVGGSSKNTHIRKSRSAQLRLDSIGLDDVGSGAALSRASSASLGLSFSFTGFTMPPEEMADSKPFSDDETPEDLEAGMEKPKFRAEPTLLVYLKAGQMENLARGPWPTAKPCVSSNG